MSNSPGVLARLFRRASPTPVVSSLAQAALNRPLLALPSMAESVIAGYLSGEITSIETQLSTERIPIVVVVDSEPEPASLATIGVLSISGALVNRPMPGPSGGGPTSYVALRHAFDELIEDEGVSAIVLRIESPGGMASGCFDLTDHIHASRGRKPIHCLVDDYAYSAAYAIAAACDEIWVSRTGGVGSVGVCAFHYDWSGNNEQIGLKVTPIYAGAHKVDFNPNLPLSDDARASAQTSIDQTYDLFTASVARYRGVDVAVVRETEADTFYGERAVAAGLATRLGTWNDLVAHLGAPGVEAPEQVGDPDAEGEGAAASATKAAEGAGAGAPDDAGHEVRDIAAPSVDAPAVEEAESAAPTHAGMVRDFNAAALAPAIKVALFAAVTDPADTNARLDHARAVVDACAASGIVDADQRASTFVKNHTPIEQVRSELVEAKARASEAVQLQTTLPATSAAKPSVNALDPAHIYRNRSK